MHGRKSSHSCESNSLSFNMFKVGFPALASFEDSSSLLVVFSGLKVGLGFFGLLILWLEHQASDQKVTAFERWPGIMLFMYT